MTNETSQTPRPDGMVTGSVPEETDETGDTQRAARAEARRAARRAEKLAAREAQAAEDADTRPGPVLRAVPDNPDIGTAAIRPPVPLGGVTTPGTALSATPLAAPATTTPAPVPAPGQGQGGNRHKGGGPTITVRPLAGPAQVRPRHWGLLASFVLLVIAPTAIAAWYLYMVAVDQYASRVGFSVNREDGGAAIETILGTTDLAGGSGAADTDILNEYIQSQELVRRVDERLDLKALYSKPENDPVFAFGADGSIEDLVNYWSRVVRINYDASTKLIELRVLAFTPDDAQAIATAIFDESSERINALSDKAQEDAISDASAELIRAKEQLSDARAALTEFRSRTQIVDPTTDLQSQMGLLGTLQQQLADALVEHDLLIETTTRENDPRIDQALRRIEVIEARIVQERQKFGAGGTTAEGQNLATVFSEFERMNVDREYAEEFFVGAQASYDQAQVEARRQSRYLAAYIQPTLAERAEYPQRALMTGLVALFSLLAWAITALIYYSIRDRR